MNCSKCGRPDPNPLGMFRDTDEPLCQECYVGWDEDAAEATWTAGLALLGELGAAVARVEQGQ